MRTFFVGLLAMYLLVFVEISNAAAQQALISREDA